MVRIAHASMSTVVIMPPIGRMIGALIARASFRRMTRLTRLFVPIVLVGALGASAASQPPGEKPPAPRPAAPRPASPGTTAPTPARPAPEAVASRPRPPASAGAIERGRRAFTQQCSFCHGADARGGAQGGSDLLQSTIVLEDEGGTQLGQFLKLGRPEKNMPKFDLPRSQVSDLAAFLRSRVGAASGRNRARVSILVGDPKAGAAYFEGPGRCTTCHSITGDLEGIGSRYDPVMLQGRMVVPRGRGGWPGGGENDRDKPLRATITSASGPALSGDVLYLSDFYVTLKDATGRRHTVIRRGDVPKVEIVDPLHAHVALLRTLTDKDMHDLTAWLATLK
jgi:cytochrome c oxidase cbb3-type subunit 3